MQVSGSHFLLNASYEGGGGVNSQDTLFVEHATFAGIMAQSWSWGGGGGIRAAGKTHIDQALFIGNSGGNYSSWGTGGGLETIGDEARVSDSMFLSNFAGSGGGALIQNTIVLGSTFYGNGAYEYSGGLQATDSIIANSTIASNWTQIDGWGIRAISSIISNTTIDPAAAPARA